MTLKKNETVCRLCSENFVLPLMEFGFQPNSYQLTESIKLDCETRELSLWHCPHCGFVFIKDPFPNDSIYENYQWSTSFSPPQHLEWLIKKIDNSFSGGQNGLILEIGSNDGYLLTKFKEMNYTNILGLEPSEACMRQAVLNGISTINAFFDEATAESVKKKYGFPKLIICRHVIEHVPDLDHFFSNLKSLANQNSLLVIEIPSFEMTAKKGDISTIWEQHINYFTLSTIAKLVEKYDFMIDDYEYLEHGGGSLVLFLKLKVNGLGLQTEEMLLASEFCDKATDNIDRLMALVKKIKTMGKSIAAYGAGSRGISLLNFSGISSCIDFIVDDNMDKNGKYLPNTRIKIVDSNQFKRLRPDYCLILPMNCKALEYRIMEIHDDYVKSGGVFIELFKNDDFHIVEPEAYATFEKGES